MSVVICVAEKSEHLISKRKGKKEKTEAGEADDDALLAGADNEHRVHPHADGHPQGASSS